MEFKAVLQILGIVNHNFWPLYYNVNNLFNCDNSNGQRATSSQNDFVIGEVTLFVFEMPSQQAQRLLSRQGPPVHQLLKLHQKRPTVGKAYNEPWHVISNNVTFWQV